MWNWLFRHLPPRFRRAPLRDRVVLITGGSRGLGLELARVFAAEGARLALLARDPVELARAADLLGHAHVLTLPADIAVEAQVHAAVAEVVARWGRVDVLVNNAGVIEVGPFEHMGPEDWQRSFDVHVRGPLHLVQACLPHMRRGGRIVNVSSIGGLASIPHMAPYCASKHALVGLSDALRAELAPRGIAVTTVCPWLMRTGSTGHVVVKGHHAGEYRWFATLGNSPWLSARADRVARRIVDATRRGLPRVLPTLPAKLLVLADAVAPNFVAWAMRVFETFLPGPNRPAGDQGQLGSAYAPADWVRPYLAEAEQRNNE